MNNNVKRHNPQPKLVPQPYTNLLTERDSGNAANPGGASPRH